MSFVSVAVTADSSGEFSCGLITLCVRYCRLRFANLGLDRSASMSFNDYARCVAATGLAQFQIETRNATDCRIQTFSIRTGSWTETGIPKRFLDR